MNNESPEAPTRNITLGFILGWIFAVVVGIPGIMMLFESGNQVAGLLFILSALIALPPAQKFLKQKANISLSSGVRVVVIIILLAISAGSLSHSDKSSAAVSVPATPDTTHTTQPTSSAQAQAAVPTQQAAPAQQVLLSIKGTGTKSTQKFTAGGDWDLSWSYDCSNFGNQGNFQVFAYSGDGSPAFNITGVNQLGQSGSDVEHYHTGGTYYLTVNSECSWKITVNG
jgi:hypothetical protein